jgi:hypothetical protein
MTIKNPILHPVTADISGDLKNQLRPLMFQITQGDTDSHILDISLVNGASIVELSDVATVAVVFTKEDGTVSVGSADIIDMKAGKVQKTIKTSDVSCVGNVIFAVEVHEGTSQASSCQFRFPVVATLDSSDGIVSENNYSVLTSLINDVQASVDSANDAAILANDAASIANSAASAATASAERVETAVQNSETAVDNANTATTAANNAKVTIEANEDTRQQNETARITKESERLSAEILRIDAESDRSSSESQRILAEDDRKTSETSRKSGETNRISAENTRVNSENSRISAESTRSDDEDTRVSNESTRVFSENQRKTNETDRVLQFNDVLEFAMLSESDAGVLDYTTEKDESGRVIRRNFTDSTGIVRKSIERLDFNANDDPVTIKKKTFSASAKGESYKKHTVGYSVDGGVVSDAVVELPYEAVESVTTARNSITSDPVELYNPDSNIASFQANELVKRMPFRNVLANNMSSLEIIGNKMVEPFATGKDEYIDADGMPYVGGDTLDINYDFYTKTAGDTNPMKIYSANIDPSNPPAPTDLSWKEITDQATIDRLKLQNELPITSTDTTG